MQSSYMVHDLVFHVPCLSRRWVLQVCTEPRTCRQASKGLFRPLKRLQLSILVRIWRAYQSATGRNFCMVEEVSPRRWVRWKYRSERSLFTRIVLTDQRHCSLCTASFYGSDRSTGFWIATPTLRRGDILRILRYTKDSRVALSKELVDVCLCATTRSQFAASWSICIWFMLQYYLYIFCPNCWSTYRQIWWSL